MAATGENEQALRKIIDFTRMASIVILVLHFYYTCHFAFEVWGYTSPIMDNILLRLSKTGLFQNSYVSKLFILGLLVISLFGSKGKNMTK